MLGTVRYRQARHTSNRHSDGTGTRTRRQDILLARFTGLGYLYIECNQDSQLHENREVFKHSIDSVDPQTVLSTRLSYFRSFSLLPSILSPSIPLLYRANNSTCIMNSAGGPEAEFQDPHRRKLLRDLNHVLRADIRPTAWACLWLSDMDYLWDIFTLASAQVTRWTPLMQSFLSVIEDNTKLVQKCRVINSPRVGMLIILFRDSTKSTSLCRFSSSARPS